jgi:hypothetical protein
MRVTITTTSALRNSPVSAAATGLRTRITCAQPRGLALKVSDEFTVPLCAIHHSENHATGDERRWWEEHKIDPLTVRRNYGTATRFPAAPVLSPANAVQRHCPLAPAKGMSLNFADSFCQLHAARGLVPINRMVALRRVNRLSKEGCPLFCITFNPWKREFFVLHLLP